MNEPSSTITAPGKKKKRSLSLPIAFAILAIALVGFIASRAGLDKALVKQVMDSFIAQMKEKARVQGRDLDITYGELEVVGSFASKHVVVHDPVIMLKPLGPQSVRADGRTPLDTLKISSPSIEIYPETSDLSTLRIQAPDPINFAGLEEPEKSLLKITNNTPMIWIIGKEKKGDVTYSTVSYQSPTQTEFLYLREQQTTGVEDETPTLVAVYQTLQLSVAQGSGLTSSMATDGSGLGEAKLSYRDVVLTPKEAPEGALKIAEITSGWSNQLNDKKMNVVTILSKFGPVTSDNAAVPYVPVTLDLDATYEGMMGKSPQSIAEAQAQDASMVLKKLSITTKDASLNMTANFTARASDILPVGTANIALSNVPLVFGELRKYGALNANNEAIVSRILQQITGKPVEELKDIAIPIEHIRDGAFKIGNATFQELFALLLGQALQNKTGKVPTVIIAPTGKGASPLAPQLPPADKPKPAPIEIPDHGVRG